MRKCALQAPAVVELKPARYLAGVRAACGFLAIARKAHRTGTSFIEASARDGAPQARLLDDLLAAIPTDPSEREGFAAAMSEVLGCGALALGESPYLARLSFDEIMQPEAAEEEPAGPQRAATVPSRAA